MADDFAPTASLTKKIQMSASLRLALLRFLFPFVFLAVLSCSRVLVPNPPPSAVSEAAAKSEAAPESAGKVQSEKKGDPKTGSAWVDDGASGRKVRTYDVDFARAFEESPAPRESGFKIEPASPDAHSFRYPPFKVRKRPVRVMVRRNVKEASISTAGMARLSSPDFRSTFTGRMSVEADVVGAGGTVVATVGRGRRVVQLPCTLYVGSGGGARGQTGDLLKVGDNAYRGALIIVSEAGGKNFSIINMVAVEDYLRGVVPLEIGNLREPEFEALKAQAVAARTYTYRRMAANERRLFDVVSTVADQVYGGANAEGENPDRAVLLTKDLIIAYDNEIANAFYHSTCGGRTANIEDVWGGDAVPYLRSVSDADGGKAFCSGSSSFSWTETWTASQLSAILRQYSSDGDLKPAFKGNVRRIDVRERFACGRVKTLVVMAGNAEHIAGGDKTRFLLRRNNASRQILRSSNFNSADFKDGKVTISGSGYGHGLGMCQVGAINRARAGQDFERILKAYYTGVTIRTVVDGEIEGTRYK